MATVALKNIAKTYDGRSFVIKDASFDINHGEFVVLVGPSGCGKSTLLRMIAGLEEISKGDMFIDEVRVNDLPPKDRNIAMVFQNYALYPHMTAYQNMAFGLKLKRIKKSAIDRQVRRAAEILEITELLDRKPKAMSGGQRQRIAIGRAIVRDPKVFLFDEPLSNLDAKLRVQMRVELQKLHQRLQTTMVYVTHDQTEAMTLGERIIVLKDGDIMQIGSPMKLYNEPDNMFVAGFIGSPPINFIQGKIIEGEGLRFVNQGLGIEFALQEEGIRGLGDNVIKGLGDFVDREVVMGVRPEDISAFPKDGRLNQSFTTDVSAIEQMGNEMLIYAQLGKQQLIARLSPEAGAKAGDGMELFIDLSKVHFFNKETELVIR
jgi:multiple sugar transport system ATP-binding protein